MSTDTRKKPVTDTNHGEGDPEAAERFNKAEQEFVHSARGKRRIRANGSAWPDEEAQVGEAERLTHSLPKDSPWPEDTEDDDPSAEDGDEAGDEEEADAERTGASNRGVGPG